MNVDNLSGGGWDPKATWHRVHGDTKSSVGGAFHMETMLTSNGEHKIKLVSSAGSDTAIVPGPDFSLPACVVALKAHLGIA